MNPMMIAFAMDKQRRKPAADAGKPAGEMEAEDAAPTMEDAEDEGSKRNCIYLGGEMPDLPVGEITATVKGMVVGEGADKRIEVAEVNGVKVAGEAVEPEDDDGAAMSDALAKEYGRESDQEEA